MAFPPVPPVPAVSPPEARDLIDSGALLIDVRAAQGWTPARIPGADHKPLPHINDWYPDLPADRAIVVQCATGARSEAVVKALTRQVAMTDVHNLAGGIVAWAQAGLPIES